MKVNNNQNIGTNKLIETKDILFIWRLILKNLIVIITIPLFAYLIGYIYSYRLSNIYGAKAELMLKSNEQYDYQDPIYKGLGAYGMYMDVQNQIRVLTSHDLIGEVIDKINIETSYYVVGRLKKQEVFKTLPFISTVEVLNRNIYEHPVGVKILDKNEYQITYEVDGRSETIKGEFGQTLETPDFYLTLEKNYTFVDESMNSITEPDYEIVFHSREGLIGLYRSRLSVENIEFTSILSVSVTDELQQRAKVFLDTLTHSYIDHSERIQLEVNQNTLENIQKQIDTVSAFIKEKEEELLRYKDANFILDIEKEKDQNFEEYVSYRKDKRELERSISSIKSLVDYLDSDYDERILPPSFYIEEKDFYLSDAIEKVRDKQIELEILRTQVKESHLSIRNLKSEISNLKYDISVYLGNLEDALNDELLVVSKFVSQYENEIKLYPKSAQGILNIQRELDVNNKMYLFLLEKKTNTLITRAGIVPQVRLIERTINQGVISPDKGKIKTLFLIGGIILALLVAIIRNFFFERINSVAALADTTDMMIAGGIPLNKEQGYRLLIEDNPKSHGTECFRTIRTNLSFMSKTEGKGRKVLISSFHPGEGKTFCSTNLAALMAKSDKKVLFLDFDLHRPKIHKVFQLENDKGVSTYIIGKHKVDEIIHKDLYPNLDVVTSGPIPPNASELVLSDKIDELFKWAEEEYDYILVDTPPFGVLNDTFQLLKSVDNLLVVLRSNQVTKRGVNHVEDLISRHEGISAGLILNGIKQTKLQYYYSKYGYRYSYSFSYGYGYGYGYGGEYGIDESENSED